MYNSTTDEVVTIARKLTGSLAATMPLPAEPRNYRGFEFSTGWSTSVKQRHGLGRMKQRDSRVGDSAKFGIPAMKESIRTMASGTS